MTTTQSRSTTVLKNQLRLLSKVARAVGIIAVFCLACSSGNDVLVGYNRGNTEGGRAGSTSAAGATFVGTQGGGVALGGTTSSETSSDCTNGGPPIMLPTIGGCTNDLAKRVFRFAVCTCSDFVSANTIITNSFDSRVANGFDAGASVGVNGSYRAYDAQAQLGGSLWVLGDTEIGYHDIAGDLQCKSALSVTSTSRVQKDAYVMGNIEAPTLTIDGTLSIWEGATSIVQAATGGIKYLRDMSVPTPCDCQNPIDIAAVIAHFAGNNDNALQSLTPSAFAATNDNVERTLPCGRYYFESFGGTGALTLHLTGKTLIAIGSGLSNSGGLVFDLAPSAELDLFVGGDLEVSSRVTMGNANRPAATRVYVAGQAAFSANLSLHANFYVPNHLMAMSAPCEFWGSLFAKSVHTSGGLVVHYDQAILELPSCTVSGQSCGSCHDCANPTPSCRNGTCATCQVDSDCCPPLYCSQGLCQVAPVLL